MAKAATRPIGKATKPAASPRTVTPVEGRVTPVKVGGRMVRRLRVATTNNKAIS